MLQACRKHDCKLVHTSTSEVYGTALHVPIDEGHPFQGQSPYSASKIGADKLVESYYRSFDVQAVTVRPFNTYGPGQSARAVIPTIITQALTQDKIHLGTWKLNATSPMSPIRWQALSRPPKLRRSRGKPSTSATVRISPLANLLI